ncbi:SDR family oxidoreductase [Streptomyces sp. NPDC006314]|uniref:SDR family NAD(P)-dependent oxidoreductase n=1 Tax=Streptomyces sp. NPDC006314 TaxID=3154475 RepID=UPI00339EE110
MSLHGKTFLVTGAGSGIGRAVARQLIGEGARAVLVGRRATALRETAGAAADEQALVHPADIARPAAAAGAVRAALDRFGGLDGLVNNAGLARFGPLAEADPNDLTAMLDVNLMGPVHLIRAALPALRAAGGSVVNVSSVGGVLAMPRRAVYGASKAALNSLTRSLARELAPHIRVNAVLPGPVDTPMYDDLGLAPEQVAQLRDDLVDSTPLGRFGTPDDVSSWVCRLLDPEAAGWVTGALIPVDGGRTS